MSGARSGSTSGAQWNPGAETAYPVGIGGAVFGWLADADMSWRVLDAFYEAGGRFIDTSDGYSHASRAEGLDSESLIGLWIRSRGLQSGDIRVITKVGLCPGVSGLRPATVLKAAENSLNRLGIDSAEAILLHADDGTTDPSEIAESLTGVLPHFAVRVGVSGFSGDRLRHVDRAMADLPGSPRLAIIQEEFSLVAPDGNRILDVLEPHRRPRMMCSAALARGFLAGPFGHGTDRAGHRRAYIAHHYSTPAHRVLLDEICRISERHVVSPAAVAIRWLLDQPDAALPLVGMTRRDQVMAFKTQSFELSEEESGVLDAMTRAVLTLREADANE